MRAASACKRWREAKICGRSGSKPVASTSSPVQPSRLCTLSPVFRRIWRAPEINVRSFGMHRFRHPRYGDLAFEHTSYVPDGHPDIRVVVCMPHDAPTKQAVAKLHAEIAAAE